MTKFESLIKCRNHWQWLAITGSPYKLSYEPSYGWMSACACCEYVENLNTSPLCEGICPLMGYAWFETVPTIGTDAPCLKPQSLYFRWRQAETLKELQLCAQKMVDACNRAIEDMIIKGEMG